MATARSDIARDRRRTGHRGQTDRRMDGEADGQLHADRSSEGLLYRDQLQLKASSTDDNRQCHFQAVPWSLVETREYRTGSGVGASQTAIDWKNTRLSIRPSSFVSRALIPLDRSIDPGGRLTYVSALTGPVCVRNGTRYIQGLAIRDCSGNCVHLYVPMSPDNGIRLDLPWVCTHACTVSDA